MHIFEFPSIILALCGLEKIQDKLKLVHPILAFKLIKRIIWYIPHINKRKIRAHINH